MPQYLPVSSYQAGRDLSEALWNIASPLATRPVGTVTTHYCGVVEDANGQWWLEIPADSDLPINPLVTQAQLDAVVAHIDKQEDLQP